MVVFTCDGCGESVKKNQVDKHRGSCRRVHTFTCMDCLKTFAGDSFRAHIKCVSEEQKYAAKGYVKKENKGEVKQDKWTEQVQNAIRNTSAADGMLKKLLNDLVQYTNIPRKEKKFINFLENSLRIRNPGLARKAWEAISKASEMKKDENGKEKEKEEVGNNGKEETKLNGQETEVSLEEDKKGKKRRQPEDLNQPESNGIASKKSKQSSDLEESNREERNGIQEIRWNELIKKTLKEAPEGRMKIKKLRKKIVKQVSGSTEVEEGNLETNFGEYLAKCSRVVIDDSGKFAQLISKKKVEQEVE